MASRLSRGPLRGGRNVVQICVLWVVSRHAEKLLAYQIPSLSKSKPRRVPAEVSEITRDSVNSSVSFPIPDWSLCWGDFPESRPIQSWQEKSPAGSCDKLPQREATAALRSLRRLIFCTFSRIFFVGEGSFRLEVGHAPEWSLARSIWINF